MKISLDTKMASTTASPVLGYGVCAVAGSAGMHSPNGMPPAVPASELYFWSAKWQEQERTFETDRAAGELVEANSMDEVIHDLMRLDD